MSQSGRPWYSLFRWYAELRARPVLWAAVSTAVFVLALAAGMEDPAMSHSRGEVFALALFYGGAWPVLLWVTSLYVVLAGWLYDRWKHRTPAPIATAAPVPFPGYVPAHYLGGVGYPLTPGQPVWLRIDSVPLLLGYRPGVPPIPLGPPDVLEVKVGGAGRYESGGGFVGGGIGLEGAAQGMLIAGALNALTTRTHVDSKLRIISRQGELFFAFERLLPGDAEIALAGLRHAIRTTAGPTVPAQQDAAALPRALTTET